MSKTKLHCSSCHKKVSLDEKVILDELNTISHKSCGPSIFNIKSTGTLQELIQKYDFLNEILHGH